MGSIGAVTISSAVVGNTISLPSYAGNGDRRREIENELKERIESAKNNGYEIIPRPYQTRGRSGQLYNWTETNIEFGAKPSDSKKSLSSSSNLGKHLENVRNQYEDVIVLPSSPILPYTTKGRYGFKTTYKAEFVVMARRRKK